MRTHANPSRAPAAPAPAASTFLPPVRGFDAQPAHAAPIQQQAEPDREPAALRADAVRSPGAGAPLPPAVRGKMEAALGHDFASVRVHHDDQAERIGARAFARGEHLHFARGTYAPSTPAGQRLLGHELTHVVQQRAGRVAVPRGPGLPVNEDPALEREADTHGAAAARGVHAPHPLTAPTAMRQAAPATDAPVQGVFGWLWGGGQKQQQPPAQDPRRELDAKIAQVAEQKEQAAQRVRKAHADTGYARGAKAASMFLDPQSPTGMGEGWEGAANDHLEELTQTHAQRSQEHEQIAAQHTDLTRQREEMDRPRPSSGSGGGGWLSRMFGGH